MVKKNLLGVVALGAALLGGMMVSPVNAAEVAIDDEATLKSCLATTDSTCKMATDVELTNGIDIAKDVKVVLDLNGYTVSYNPTDPTASYAINNSGNLTIMDGSAGGSGKIIYNAANPDTETMPGYVSDTIRNYGDLVINSGTIENTTEGGTATYAVDSLTSTASLTINGGKIVAIKPAIRLFLNSENTKDTAFDLTINGGEITGSRGIFIQLPNGASAKTKYANININGGTITRTNEDDLALYTYSFGEPYDGLDINITGGTFNGDVAVHGGSSNGGTGFEKVRVSGGIFNTDGVYTYGSGEHNIALSGGKYAIAPEDEYIAAGYKVIEEGNKYTITLNAPVVNDAVNDADENEETNESILEKAGADLIGEIVEDLGTADEIKDGDVVELSDGTKLEITNAENLKTALANGGEIKLELTAGAVGIQEKEVTDLIQANLPEGAKEFAEMGIDVKMTAGGEFVGKLTEFSESLQLALEVTDFEEVEEGYTREWGVIRIHFNTETGEYEATAIPAAYNAETKSVEFESDKLSVYVPYYVDTLVPGAPKTGVFGSEATSAAQDIAAAVLFAATMTAVVLLGVAAKAKR